MKKYIKLIVHALTVIMLFTVIFQQRADIKQYKSTLKVKEQQIDSLLKITNEWNPEN